MTSINSNNPNIYILRVESQLSVIITAIYICNSMMHKTQYSVGPKFFGTSNKKSWFDEGDRCAPGPGAHDLKRLNITNPPTWTAGKDTERDAFLDKFHRQYPSPDRYNVVDPNKTHIKDPVYSIPVYEHEQNPNKIDEGNSLDYRPRYNAPKPKYPDYSFGYYFERDYTTKVPPPNAYNSKVTDKISFNRTQRTFSIGERPPPYGEEGRYPYVGKYNVSEGMAGTKNSIGNGDRPDYTVGAGADNIYNISGQILHAGKGKTMGLFIEVPRNKDQLDYPEPNKYNPQLPRTDRNIITYRGKRSQIKNEAIQAYPSPQKYEPKLNSKEQTVSFTMEKRYSPEPAEYPGVGTYQVEKELSKTLGNIGLKLKKLTQFVNPAPSAYEPKDDLTKPRAQQSINCYSSRTDFSRSITGKVGPGIYQIHKEQPTALGKIGKGDKFPPNKNKNPGPGSYEIPGGIGKLPKYCSGPKKLTTTGFSFIELERQERIKSHRARQEVLLKQKEEEENRLRQQREAAQKK